MGDATQVEDKIKIVQILFSLVYICFFSQILGAFLVIVLIRHPPQAPRQVPEGNLTLFSLFFFKSSGGWVKKKKLPRVRYTCFDLTHAPVATKSGGDGQPYP